MIKNISKQIIVILSILFAMDIHGETFDKATVEMGAPLATSQIASIEQRENETQLQLGSGEKITLSNEVYEQKFLHWKEGDHITTYENSKDPDVPLLYNEETQSTMPGIKSSLSLNFPSGLPSQVTVWRKDARHFDVDSYYEHLGTIEVSLNNTNFETYTLKNKNGDIIATATIEFDLKEGDIEMRLFQCDVYNIEGKHMAHFDAEYLPEISRSHTFWIYSDNPSMYLTHKSFLADLEDIYTGTHFNTNPTQKKLGTIARHSASSFFSLNFDHSYSLLSDKKTMEEEHVDPLSWLFIAAARMAVTYYHNY